MNGPNSLANKRLSTRNTSKISKSDTRINK